MITNKDIRVENGSLIINGDPYPLDGQSPETIMGIVEENSDTTPTEDSTAPITSGGVFTALDGSKIKIVNDTLNSVDISTTWGSFYMSNVLEINYTSLGLTNPPKNVSISVSSNTTIMVGLSAITATKAEYRLMRPASATGLTVNVSALIVY